MLPLVELKRALTKDLPTPSPLALKKVKIMPPPRRITSHFSIRASITVICNAATAQEVHKREEPTTSTTTAEFYSHPSILRTSTNPKGKMKKGCIYHTSGEHASVVTPYAMDL